MIRVTRLRLAKMRLARDRMITPDPVTTMPGAGNAGSQCWRSRAAGVLTLLAALAWVLLLSPADGALAQSRSWQAGEVRIDAELADDGAMRVVEEREFVYDGQFFGAFYELPLRRGQSVTLNGITDEQGTSYRPGTCEPEGTQEPGAYELDDGGGEFTITWCWDPPPADTTRTITLDYTVTGAGTRHDDASQLYWQFVGTGWDVPTTAVVADVRLPTAEDVQFWAHGPLTGEVTQPEPGSIRMQVDDLPANTFVELRALMPAAALAAAESDGEAVREDVLAEEECLAVAANAERARARGEQPAQDCDPAAGRKNVMTGLLALGLVGGGAGWWMLFRRHGREHPLPEWLPDYEHELPSEHPPAFVDYLLNWGTTTDKALVATILDLARRGHLKLRRELQVEDRLLLPDREHTVTIFERVSMPERQWERMVVELLFDDAAHGGDTVTDRELKSWVESHREGAYSWWQSWKSAVARDTTGNHWIESTGWVAASIGIGLLLLGAAIGLAIIGANLIVAIVAGVAGVAAMAASPLMRRRTPEGRILEHRWRRFGAYLTDYSLIPERGPEYLVLWGHWLVYAVPLGVADTVMRNLNAKLSQAELEQVGGGWYPMYIGGYGFGGFGEGMTAISDAIPTSQIATSPQSSASGGGGGFSGGGGGGGGGSGGGSF
ncbi:MAG TPA: DUF2207 domain-containing protein [Euzebyales bacterium]|nr:DUF2207 domain-containing protein [Euzebyales bacterium]